ncbi:MAG: hypothetical protein ABSH36_02595 [Solirubrobacteraceae bacterium]
MIAYGQASPDPDAEQLLCSGRELEQAGFSIGYHHEMPILDSQRFREEDDPLGAEADALLAEADLESPEICARAMQAVQREMDCERERLSPQDPSRDAVRP